MSILRLIAHLVWRHELDCRGAGLNWLFKLILLWNVGNQWLVIVASTFTLLGLEAFEN